MTTDDVHTNFPVTSLISKPTITNILKQFHYMRTGVRVHIITTASIFTYGMIGVVPFPMNARSRTQYAKTDNEQFDTWSMFGAVLSVQDSVGVTFDLGWNSPANFGNAQNWQDTWQIGIFGLNIQSATTDTVPTCQVQLYGELYDTELTGQRYESDPVFYEAHSFMDQAGPPIARVIRDVNGLIVGAKAVAGAITVGGVVAGIGEKILDVVYSDDPVASVKEKVKETIQDENPTHPAQGRREAVRQNFYGNMSSFSPGNEFQSIGDRSRSTILDNSMISCQKQSDIWAMVRQWTVIHRDEFSMATTQILNTPYMFLAIPDGGGLRSTAAPAEVELYEPGYLSSLSQFFKYWRGSIEFRITVYSPMTVSARINWVINFVKETIPNDIDGSYVLSRAGSMKSEVVAVKGTTTFDIVVPFMNYRHWALIGDAVGCPVVVFSLTAMEPRLKGATPLTLPFTVQKRAGSDFCFRQFDGGLVRIEQVEPPFYEGHMLNDEWFSQGETMVMLCNRMSRAKTPNTIGIPGEGITGTSGNLYTISWTQASLLDKMSLYNLYFTGTHAYKVVFDSAQNLEFMSASYPSTKKVQSTTVSDNGYYHVEAGMVVTDQNTFRMLEVEVPYESQYPLYFTGGFDTDFEFISEPLGPILHSTKLFDQTPIPQTVFECARPDFAFKFPIPPPDKINRYYIDNFKIGPVVVEDFVSFEPTEGHCMRDLSEDIGDDPPGHVSLSHIDSWFSRDSVEWLLQERPNTFIRIRVHVPAFDEDLLYGWTSYYEDYNYVHKNCSEPGQLYFGGSENEMHIVTIVNYDNHIQTFTLLGNNCSVQSCAPWEQFKVICSEPFLYVNHCSMNHVNYTSHMADSSRKEFVYHCHCLDSLEEYSEEHGDDIIECHSLSQIGCIMPCLTSTGLFSLLSGQSISYPVNVASGSYMYSTLFQLADPTSTNFDFEISSGATSRTFLGTCSSAPSCASFNFLPGDEILGSSITLTNNGPNIQFIGWTLNMVNYTLTNRPLIPTESSSDIPQPLWVSNHKVAEDADGVSAPVWISNYKI